MPGNVVVVGASGLIGQAAVRRFDSEPGWDVVAVSRRRPVAPGDARFVAVDLLDEHATARELGSLVDVTHLVYAAVHEVPGLVAGWSDEATIERNAAMLRNTLGPLLDANPRLRHVSLLQGTKAYGVHLPDRGRAPLPLRERDTWVDQRNFYFEQERELRERAAGSGLRFTIWRPTVVWGDAPGNNMNPLLPIAVHGALLRADGRALDFPGAELAPWAREAVDADLVAEALLWAASAPSAAAGTFNITNGDVYCWPDVWPALAGALRMATGAHRPLSLAEELPRRADDWAALVREHGLRADPDPVRYVGANSLAYADQLLRGTPPRGAPVLNSTIALRRAGFAGCRDTEAMFVDHLEGLQADGWLPPAPGPGRRSST